MRNQPSLRLYLAAVVLAVATLGVSHVDAQRASVENDGRDSQLWAPDFTDPFQLERFGITMGSSKRRVGVEASSDARSPAAAVSSANTSADKGGFSAFLLTNTQLFSADTKIFPRGPAGIRKPPKPHAPLATFTWDGGSAVDGRWDRVENWNPDGAPPIGAVNTDLLFNNSTRLSNTIGPNDYKLSDLTFGASAGAFIISSDPGKKLIFEEATGSITNSSASLQTISVSIIQNSSALTIGGSGNISIGSAIESSGSIIKTGAGTLTLSGANIYTGTTTVNAGTLRSGANNVLPNTSAVTVSGTGAGTTATLDLNGFNDTIGSLTLGGSTTTSGSAVTTGAGTLTLGGNVIYSATNNPLGATIAGQLALGGNRTFTVGDSSSAAADLTVSAIVSGSFTVTKAGAGTLVFSGDNTYTGTTTISAGVLNISHADALGDTGSATNTVVSSGAALELQNGIAVDNETLNTLAGTGISNGGALRNVSGNNSWAGTITLPDTAQTVRINSDAGTLTIGGGITEGSGNDGDKNLTFGGAGNVTVSGVISGTHTDIALTKDGSGTLTLTNANTYGGATTVNAGTLLANNATGSATSTGAVTVNNSGTVLGGTGTINGAVTVNATAKLQGGNGNTGTTLTLAGGLTLADNSIIQLALGPGLTHSTLARSGSNTWTFDSNQAFTFIDSGATTGTYQNIITNIANPPSEGSWTITNPGWTGTFIYDGTNIDLNLTAVPEPSTWIGGALAVGILAWSQRRRLTRLIKRTV